MPLLQSTARHGRLLLHVYGCTSIIHMTKLRRKQLILPQDKLTQVRQILGAKSDTEAVILSLEAVLRQRKLAEFADLPGKLRLSLTVEGLGHMRAGR